MSIKLRSCTIKSFEYSAQNGQRFSKIIGRLSIDYNLSSSITSIHISVKMINISTNTQIGLGLTGFGLTFICLGIVLMFDKGLLAIGNILFIVGLGFIIGFWKAFHFFFQWQKFKGSTAFFLGMITVIAGHPVIGILIEACGFYLLFRAFIPTVFDYLKRLLPFWGSIKNRSIV